MSLNKTVQNTNITEGLLCPVRYALGIVGGKWKLPILCMLSAGQPARYSLLKRKLNGITNMMLTQSLKELEQEHMVNRKQYNEIPPRVEYTLTEKGKSILPIVIQLGEWGIEALQQDPQCGHGCEQCQKTV